MSCIYRIYLSGWLTKIMLVFGGKKMNSITKAISLIAVLLLAMFVAVTGASAQSPLGITVTYVKVNGDSLNANQSLRTQFERDSKLDITVKLRTDGTTKVDDVEVRAFISGTKDSIEDSTEPFDVQPNVIYTKELSLEVPQRSPDRDYQLRVIVSSPNSNTISYIYPLIVEAVEHSIAIKEATFSPSNKVVAGRSFTAVARLKNYGQADEDDVKVVISIPELGVKEVDYINEIEKDETVSSEELLLRIPPNAKSGEYEVKVEAYFDDYDEKTSVSYTIYVEGESSQTATGAGAAAGKTVVTVGIQSQTAAKGENGVIYPLTLANNANTAKTYTLEISGADTWAVTKVSPSNVVVLNAGESKQAYVYVAANENSPLGKKVFSINIKSGNDVVQQIPLELDVMESAKGNALEGVKKALQVGVILLVVLVVVLAAVILYQRKGKGSAKEDEQIAQTYY